MRKLVVLASSLLVLGVVFGAMALQAGAQDVPSLHALKNQTPIVKLAACNGYTGSCGCAPGWISSCRHRCCRCVRCY
jgi:hypothetical protein